MFVSSTVNAEKRAVRVAVGVAVFSSACSAGGLFLWTCFSHVAPMLTLQAFIRKKLLGNIVLCSLYSAQSSIDKYPI